MTSDVTPDFSFPQQNCIDEIETVISAKLQLVGIVGIGVSALTVRKFQNGAFALEAASCLSTFFLFV